MAMRLINLKSVLLCTMLQGNESGWNDMICLAYVEAKPYIASVEGLGEEKHCKWCVFEKD